MNESQTLTVKEFAAAAKVKEQTIYKQLKGRLSSFVVEEYGKKKIKKEALEIFYPHSHPDLTQKQPEINSDSSNSKPEINPDSTETQPYSYSNSSDYPINELLEMLKEEIKKKDQQIEHLQKRLDHAQDLIADMAQKAQYITAADKTEKIMQQQPEEKIVEHAAEGQNIENNLYTESKPKKKWFQFWK